MDDTQDIYTRLEHLERSLEALQDSVYRDKLKYESELAALRELMAPENMARALSDDARRRGL
jgi:hypothetical protein